MTDDQNDQKKKKPKAKGRKTSSGYTGVSRTSDNKSWRLNFKKGDIVWQIGSYKDEKAAAKDDDGLAIAHDRKGNMNFEPSVYPDKATLKKKWDGILAERTKKLEAKRAKKRKAAAASSAPPAQDLQSSRRRGRGSSSATAAADDSGELQRRRRETVHGANSPEASADDGDVQVAHFRSSRAVANGARRPRRHSPSATAPSSSSPCPSEVATRFPRRAAHNAHQAWDGLVEEDSERRARGEEEQADRDKLYEKVSEKRRARREEAAKRAAAAAGAIPGATQQQAPWDRRQRRAAGRLAGPAAREAQEGMPRRL
ncbi:g7673 [Coccomyxa elongata]